MEYDYQQAMAHHAAALTGHNNQLHPAMAQIPMLSAAGLNLTVMPTGLAQGGQHHLGQIQGHHQIMYQNVQPAQNATHVTHHQQQQQQQNHHSNHHQQQQQGHGGHGQQGMGQHGKGNKKKPKVNKDGVPAPKRATTAYINFTQWYREELKKSGRPIPKIGDFGKECAAKWNGMPEDDKKPFLDVANKDRERYKREMQIYKPARDANKPKRPGTAFMLFMGDFRKEMAGKEPEGGVAALAKLGGERWRNMSEEDKRPYVERQNIEKQRYEVAMEEYRRKSAGGVVMEAVMAAGVDTGVSAVKQSRLSSDGSDSAHPAAGGTSSSPTGDHSNSTAAAVAKHENNTGTSGDDQGNVNQISGSDALASAVAVAVSHATSNDSGDHSPDEQQHQSMSLYSQQQQQQSVFNNSNNSNSNNGSGSYAQSGGTIAVSEAGNANSFVGQGDAGATYQTHAAYANWQ